MLQLRTYSIPTHHYYILPCMHACIAITLILQYKLATQHKKSTIKPFIIETHAVS